MNIIDADKLLEFIDTDLNIAYLNSQIIPQRNNGDYDWAADVQRHMEYWLYKQLLVIRNYIEENKV